MTDKHAAPAPEPMFAWEPLLRESRENFVRQFGVSEAADWIYRDLAELFAAHPAPVAAPATATDAIMALAAAWKPHALGATERYAALRAAVEQIVWQRDSADEVMLLALKRAERAERERDEAIALLKDLRALDEILSPAMRDRIDALLKEDK